MHWNRWPILGRHTAIRVANGKRARATFTRPRRFVLDFIDNFLTISTRIDHKVKFVIFFFVFWFSLAFARSTYFRFENKKKISIFFCWAVNVCCQLPTDQNWPANVSIENVQYTRFCHQSIAKSCEKRASNFVFTFKIEWTSFEDNNFHFIACTEAKPFKEKQE